MKNLSMLLVLIVICCRVESRGQLQSLDETSWHFMLKGEWMVEFFAPWCPACQQLKPNWEEFAEWSDDLGIKVGNVDVTANPGLSGRFMITALPTIFHVKDGVFRQYRGARDKDSFISFVEDKKWQSLDPVSSWKSPQSFQMSAVAYFFKLSMYIRSVHTTLVEDYGLPYWLSYMVFGISTIVVGAILGLVIVCILDTVCYSRTAQKRSTDPNVQEREHEQGNEDFEGEDIIQGHASLQSAEEDAGDLRQRQRKPVAE